MGIEICTKDGNIHTWDIAVPDFAEAQNIAATLATAIENEDLSLLCDIAVDEAQLLGLNVLNGAVFKISKDLPAA